MGTMSMMKQVVMKLVHMCYSKGTKRTEGAELAEMKDSADPIR
jgi:hypothetical protein